MPELAAPGTYQLPGTEFRPLASPINPNLQWSAPVIDTSKAAKAQAIAGIAQALATLPQTLAKDYQTGRAIRTDELTRDKMEERLKSGDLDGMSISVGPGGSTVGMGSKSDPILRGYARDLAKAKVAAAQAGPTRYKQIVEAISNGQHPVEPELPTHEDTGGHESNLNIAARYKFDPETGSLVANGSSFGGKADATGYEEVTLPDGTKTKNYYDNGLFGTGGASVLVADDKAPEVPGLPKGYRHSTPADIEELRKNPNDPRFIDNPERYAAFPKAMYDSGAVRPGDQVKMRSVDAQGNEHWATAIARDVGPNGKLKAKRGWDGSPALLKDLNVGTDQPVNIYFPNPDAAAGVIASTAGLPKKQSDLSAMGTPTPATPTPGATVAPGVTAPAPAPDGALPKGNYVDPATGNAYVIQPNGDYLVYTPSGAKPTRLPARQSVDSQMAIFPSVDAAKAANVDMKTATILSDGRVKGKKMANEAGMVFNSADEARSQGYDPTGAEILDQSGKIRVTKVAKMDKPNARQYTQALDYGVDISGMSRDDAATAITAKQKEFSELTPVQQKGWDDIRRRMSQNPLIKTGGIRAAGYGNVVEGHELKNGAGDMMMIEGFARMLNPTVGVSGQMVSNFKDALPIVEKWWPGETGLPWNKFWDGAKLTPAGRDMFLAAATKGHKAEDAKINNAIQGYYEDAKVKGVPFESLQRAARTAYLVDDGVATAPTDTSKPDADKGAIDWLKGDGAKPENKAKADQLRAILQRKGLL